MSSDINEPPITWDNFLTSANSTARGNGRIARNVHVINERWGPNWRSALRNSGISIQDKPSYQLAFSLARLTAFTSNITELLSTLSAFQGHQNEQAPVFTKSVDPKNRGLFGTVEQRTESSSYKFFQSWLNFLQTAKLPASVTTGRSGRAAARTATKRAAPPSPANTSRPRRARTSTQSVEVGRSNEAALPDISEFELQEESIAPEPDSDHTGIQLTFDEELPASPIARFSSPPYDPNHSAQAIMSRDVAHLLEDPLWRTVIQGLSKIRKQEVEQRNKVVEAEILLAQAKEELNRVLSNVRNKLAIDDEITLESLEGGIEKIEADVNAEQALHKFLRDHGAEFQQLAAASISASNHADALNNIDPEEAIGELSIKLTAYKEAKSALEEAETVVGDAQEAQKQASQVSAASEKHQKTFQEIVKAIDNDFTMRVVDEALSEYSE